LSDSESARRDYLALREQSTSVQLATLTRNAAPEASYAPCVWFEGDCFIFLSELASHTRNLLNDPSISLLLIEAENAAGNAFARKRISLFGSAQAVARAHDTYKMVIREFYQRFGEVMKLIEPLPDFHLFRIKVESGRFIRGFGQAYELAGDRLDQLVQIDPSK
jgi:hypothetical protein